MQATSEHRASMRGRWALAAVFLINGFLVGSWAPQIPVFLNRLAISEFTLGLLILLFGLGALVAMPAAGFLMARFGSRAITRLYASGAVFGLLIVALAPNVATAACALFVFGGLAGGMDVSMNANAVAVERRLKRAVMSSSHGFWSLGGFIGGGLGGLLIAGYGHLVHAAIVTVLAAAMAVLALPRLVDEPARPPAAPGRRRLALPRHPVIYLTGIMALFSMVPEGAVLDWGALYLRQELGAGLATAGFAFSAFAGAMALMRFLGDGVRNRYGAVATLRVSSLVAAAGMLIAALAPWPYMAIAGFALCGLGIANMVPIAFSAAGNQPGISSGAGMSVATTIGYCGILIAPSAVGFTAERTGFVPVFAAMALLLVVVFLMAGLARAADFSAVEPAR
jgi:MFS family permease